MLKNCMQAIVNMEIHANTEAVLSILVKLIDRGENYFLIQFRKQCVVSFSI